MGQLHEAELAALLTASADISRSLDLPETLHAIARTAADVLQAEASSVLTLDSSRTRLTFQAAYGGTSGDLVGQEMDAELGIAGKVMRSAQPVLVPDVQTDPHFFQGFDQKSSFVTRQMIAAPMFLREEIIGVVEVINRQGGGTFVQRDVDLLQLFANLAALSVANAQQHAVVKRENLGLKAASEDGQQIIGASSAWEQVLKLIQRVAGTNASVLLLGETGTGKEVCAREVHRRSPRADRAFVPINCAALPETLLESELFGHEAGAFTGATSQKLGRFELADGGTLFLDEIGDISPSTQTKLLRVLQEREFVRVGGTKTLTCDVRIVAATNKNLEAAMEAGEFREDLYYRLNVFPIRLPPLRERKEDIPLLLDHFVKRSAVELGVREVGISDAAMAGLCAHEWPGNIRELRNVIERAVLLCDSDEITVAHLPRELSVEDAAPHASSAEASVGHYEKTLIIKALREHDWNQTRAAEALGLSRDNLRYRLKKYDIKKPE
jgi:Nif-specific regulatory protein